MKKFKLFILAFVGCIAMTACGGDDYGIDQDDVVAPNANYKETINIPAEGCDKEYTLDMLKSQIASVSSTPAWLTITTQSYTGGSPSIQIVAKENTTEKERKTTVTVNTATETLALTFVQAGKENIPSGIDDIHNGTSGKPAYTPAR